MTLQAIALALAVALARIVLAAADGSLTKGLQKRKTKR